MGSVAGVNTRRYHGLLVAATTPPTGRMLLLAAIDAFIEFDGSQFAISSNQYPGAVYPDGSHYLKEFSVGGFATWTYRPSGLTITKTLTMNQGENAVTVEYRNDSTVECGLVLRPLICHRDHHGEFAESPQYPEKIVLEDDRSIYESSGTLLVLNHPHAERTPVNSWYYRFEHQREYERGLNPRDDLYCPCELRFRLAPGQSATLVAADFVGALPAKAIVSEKSPTEFRLSVMLKDAAKNFLVETKERTSIIAGYPWFTDWGRDTMIALPGLLLKTGKVIQAREILYAYASQLHQGLIPNRFVERGETPDYNTVDATLWFANAIYKTLSEEWNEKFAIQMLVALEDVYDWHYRGTLFGIRVDQEDGLLTQGEEGVQLTWMDAKIGDWVVTPRRGKPVEINALWINLLHVLAWLHEQIGTSDTGKVGQRDRDWYLKEADLATSSFELKFWHDSLGYYLDTVEPDDTALRPNQVVAMALPFSPVNAEHGVQALEVVTRELLTPVGLRTLGREEAGYKGRFRGSLPELDAAYHQGTVWPWLMGSYITAFVKFSGDKKQAKKILRNVKEMLLEYGIGGIAEVYDGDLPQSPGGCPWQAWSVAEILRAWVEDVQGE